MTGVAIRRLRRVLEVLGVITLLVVVGLMLGWTQDAYMWLWTNTTGRPWTFVMRDNVWIFPTVSGGALAALARGLPLRYWTRVVIMWSTFALGFLGGHVFW